MAELEKVIKGLEHCSTTNGHCQWAEHLDCPYIEDCKAKKYSALDRDALELLKEYQEKIETARKWLKEDSVDIEFIAKRFVI